jgi:hypothetical protein
MSNIDALVTNDLGAAAAANRDRLRTLDDTLRAVAPAETVAVPRTTTMTDLRLLALADVFATRMARTVAGAVALVCVLATIASMVAFHFDVGWSFITIFGGSPVDLVPRFAIAVLGAHVLGMAAARALFARSISDDAGSGEAMVARLDRWTIASSIIGPFVCVMVVGIAFVTAGYDRTTIFACSLDVHCRGVGFDTAMYYDRMRDLAIAMPICLLMIGAVVARLRPGHAGKTPRVLERGRTIVIGIAIMISTIVLGMRYDDGLWRIDERGMFQPAGSTELRTLLTITGGVGLLLTLTALALWRRRRELQRIASASSRS